MWELWPNNNFIITCKNLQKKTRNFEVRNHRFSQPMRGIQLFFEFSHSSSVINNQLASFKLSQTSAKLQFMPWIKKPLLLILRLKRNIRPILFFYNLLEFRTHRYQQNQVKTRRKLFCNRGIRNKLPRGQYGSIKRPFKFFAFHISQDWWLK